MSKKDYEAVADFIYKLWGNIPLPEEYETENQFEIGYEAAIDDMSHGLAIIFARENERFDTQRFLRACGVLN